MASWVLSKPELSTLNQFNGMATAAQEPEGSHHWNRITDELLDVRNLPDDWDGLGAKAPPAELVDSAIQLAQLLHQWNMESPSRVVPGLTGTVLFEWQKNGIYLEIEVCRPYYAECLKVVPGKPPEHLVITG